MRPATRTYCIRPDYRPQRANRTLDAASGSTYWNPQRIRTSYRYQYAAYAHARRLAHRHGLRTVVDLGCGVATKLNHFFGEEFEIVGVDQPPAVALCRRLHARGTYIEENFEAPRYELRRQVAHIDLLISSDVIEHLEDPDRLLTYAKSVVAPTTLVVLTTPDRHALLGTGARAPVNPTHIREWSSVEFRNYLESAGFELLEHRRLPPFRFRPDRMTLKFVLDRLRRRLPLATNQMVVARVPRRAAR